MTDTTPTEIMTKAERAELAKVVRMQAKVARTQVESAKAERLAEFEHVLAVRYDKHDDRWAKITEEAQALVNSLDAELAAICEAEGLNPEHRPTLRLAWYGRGVAATNEEKSEMRRVAKSRADADERAAKAEIERWSAETCTDLVSRGLTSGEARGFLDAMPRVNALLPAIELAALEAETK